MDIYATSDLHLDQKENFLAFQQAFPFPSQTAHQQDCLILAGDICESTSQLQEIIERLRCYYQEIIWTPGNHELWVRPSQQNAGYTSADKYRQMISLCQSLSVHTPEDDFLQLPGTQQNLILAPLFVLYDYSFKPEHVKTEDAVEWAMESNVLCTDEILIKTTPYTSVVEWCEQRIKYSQQRLDAYKGREDCQLILINHFPLSQQSFHLKYIPRFSIWCGTTQTQNWHTHYRAKSVISGHLHLPSKQEIDSVSFYEVSLGYPGQWDDSQNMADLFVQIPV